MPTLDFTFIFGLGIYFYFSTIKIHDSAGIWGAGIRGGYNFVGNGQELESVGNLALSGITKGSGH